MTYNTSRNYSSCITSGIILMEKNNLATNDYIIFNLISSILINYENVCYSLLTIFIIFKY